MWGLTEYLKNTSALLLQDETHPSAMGIGQSKEGFSVFGIMDVCVSPMGKRQLKLWFLRPIVNIAVLQQRQRAIDCLMRMPDIVKGLQEWPISGQHIVC